MDEMKMVTMKERTFDELCSFSDRMDADDYDIDDLCELKAIVRKAVAEMRTFTPRG